MTGIIAAAHIGDLVAGLAKKIAGRFLQAAGGDSESKLLSHVLTVSSGQWSVVSTLRIHSLSPSLISAAASFW